MIIWILGIYSFFLSIFWMLDRSGEVDFENGFWIYLFFIFNAPLILPFAAIAGIYCGCEWIYNKVKKIKEERELNRDFIVEEAKQFLVNNKYKV